MRRVYLDHNATSPLRPEARTAIRAVIEGSSGNASSLHMEGREARARIEEARREVAALLGLPSKQVVFTSSGSEAIAMAIRGICETAPPQRRRVVVTSIEHSAVLESARLVTRHGLRIDEVPCERSGVVDTDRFVSCLGEDVALAAMQWANNETGVVQPVQSVGRECARVGVPFLVDAVQAAGKIPLDPERIHADLIAISGHKIGGPQGTGALGIRDGVSLTPLVPGGAQERRRRGGTEAVALIAGFGAAAAASRRAIEEESVRLGDLRARIETGLRERFDPVRVHGEEVARLPTTVSFAIPGAPGDLLAIALDLAGFAVSTGSACASGAVEPSHVLRAMGYPDDEAKGAVRVSIGWSTTRDDVDRFLEGLPAIVERVRRSVAPTSVS